MLDCGLAVRNGTQKAHAVVITAEQAVQRMAGDSAQTLREISVFTCVIFDKSMDYLWTL